MNEIILPIKCSTVKTINGVFTTIAIVEGLMLSALLFEYAVWSLWLMIYYYQVAQNIVDPFLMAFGVGVPCVWYLIVESHLPSIGCIKDEEKP